jgi:5-methylcytosine-specific restriction endonuclease McrA
MLDAQVLVLNFNYEPLNITNARRAIGLVLLGKAETIECNGELVRAARFSLPLPSVVKLAYFVRRPMPELKLSRKSILARDHHTCQYCGRTDGPLTVDHVVPKHRGGDTDWANLVCCCTRCNSRKGHRLPQEAGMLLRHKPRRPRYVPYISLAKFMGAVQDEKWRQYLEPFVDPSLLWHE